MSSYICLCVFGKCMFCTDLVVWWQLSMRFFGMLFLDAFMWGAGGIDKWDRWKREITNSSLSSFSVTYLMLCSLLHTLLEKQLFNKVCRKSYTHLVVFILEFHINHQHMWNLHTGRCVSHLVVWGIKKLVNCRTGMV